MININLSQELNSPEILIILDLSSWDGVQAAIPVLTRHLSLYSQVFREEGKHRAFPMLSTRYEKKVVYSAPEIHSELVGDI